MVNVSQTPYDSMKDLQKTTCTNPNIEPVYEYSTAKDINYTGLYDNVVLNEGATLGSSTETDNIFKYCPICQEYNEAIATRCKHCGYVFLI